VINLTKSHITYYRHTIDYLGICGIHYGSVMSLTLTNVFTLTGFHYTTNILNILHNAWFPAPVFGWGRYETYEFGCTVAFHDQSNGGYSYVITMLLFVLGIPLCKILYRNYATAIERI